MSIRYVSICTKDRLEPGFYTIFLSIFDRHCLRKLGASGDEGWQMVKAEGKLSHWFVRKRRVKFHAGRVANVLRKIFSHVFIAACDLWLFLIVMESVYTRRVNLNEIYMGDRIAGSTIWYAFLFYRWSYVPTRGEKSFQTWGLKL